MSNAFPDLFSSEPVSGPLRQLHQLGYNVTSRPLTSAQWDFEPALYNQLSFLGLNSETELVPFYLIKEIGRQQFVQASIHFRISGKLAVSLSGAPFGWPERATELPAKVLEFFLQQVQADLARKGMQKAEIRLPASAFLGRFAEVKSVLLAHGFQEKLTEVNHHLPADGVQFRQNLHPSAKRRLQRLHRQGFAFAEELPTKAEEIFRFIENCRKQKGYFLSMNWLQLSQALEAFPDRYFFFSVRHNGKLAAATLAVRVSEEVLYNYAPAHSAGFNAYSPVILLTEGLVSWCHKQGLQALDLGTSTLNNRPNQPLISFKERLGGIASEKCTLTKKLG